MCRECRNENEITVFRLSAVGGRSEAVKLIERSNLLHLRQTESILTLIETSRHIIRLISHLTDIITMVIRHYDFNEIPESFV